MSDEPFTTPDAAIDAAMDYLLDDIEAWARDRGADEARICRLRKLFAEVLHARRTTAVAMLEARAVHLQ